MSEEWLLNLVQCVLWKTWWCTPFSSERLFTAYRHRCHMLVLKIPSKYIRERIQWRIVCHTIYRLFTVVISFSCFLGCWITSGPLMAQRIANRSSVSYLSLLFQPNDMAFQATCMNRSQSNMYKRRFTRGLNFLLLSPISTQTTICKAKLITSMIVIWSALLFLSMTVSAKDFDHCTSATDASSLFINQTPAKLDPDPQNTVSIFGHHVVRKTDAGTRTFTTDDNELTGTSMSLRGANVFHLWNYKNSKHVSWIYTVHYKDASKPVYYYLFNEDSCFASITYPGVKDVTVTPLVPK